MHANPQIENLIQSLFELGSIGYVAIGSEQEVIMRSMPGLITATTESSNFFEELLINPSLLKMASQRGNLDCGGLQYIAIGYGEFTQLIMPIKFGHLSLGVSRKTLCHELAQRVKAVVNQHGLSPVQNASWIYNEN